MKFVLLTILLIALAVIQTHSISIPSYCFQPTGDCKFYQECLEAVLPCGSKGYAQSYGAKYCSKFKTVPFESQYAKDWIASTAKCLQDALVPTIKDIIFRRKTYTCEQVINFAFNSHPRCYTQQNHSVCKLPWKDFVRVPQVVDAKDYMSVRALKQTVSVLKTCTLGKLLKS